MNKKAYMSYIAHIGLLMAASVPDYRDPYQDRFIERTPIKIQPRPPKGTKEYFFNEHGTFLNEDTNWNHTVFKCYAMNEKNAVKKFKKAMLNN